MDISWLTIITVILSSSLLSAALTSGVTWYQANKSREENRYERLYGPLRFKLLMMKLMVDNRDEVLKDIQEWQNVETRIQLMQQHMSPLTLRWIKYKDEIKELVERNPGLIKREDFQLISDFVDGCIKREITENGKNVMEMNETRGQKLLAAVQALQKHLL